MRTGRIRGFAAAAIGICVLSGPGLADAQSIAPTRHWSGQGVAPVYEGFDVNPDGTSNMWFGYMNRNFEEEIDVSVGPDNRFEPGLDRGQPTHFDTRRHKDVFRVVVPKDFGDTNKLVWSITVRGKTESVAGTLNRVWQIDRLRTTRGGNSERINSNTPPVVQVDAPKAPAVVDRPVILNAAATDDGLPRRRGTSIGMTVEWEKYRGPGQVTFTRVKQPLADGKATATATFSEPGEYVLMAVVDDGSGESAGNFGYHCCWTNVQVTVNVTGAKKRARAHAPSGGITFTRDIAKIFQAKCTQCHHAGTGAPMALTTFEEVRPWARSIRQRVASREMPPWHLDRTVGIRKYKNDLSLSDDEIAAIVAWVDAGAPAGNPADMPPRQSFGPEDVWHIGKPDLIVKMDKIHKMYPKGPDWWIDYFGDTGLKEDRWIKAMEVRPGNRRIVHHTVAYAIEPNPPEGTPETGVQLHEYAVGKYGDTFNENTGRLLKAGTRIRFDMHYFAIGEALTDQTEIAFIFYPKGVTPKYEVRSIPFRNLPNDELEIPPNSVVRHDGYYRLARPARIDAFQPHMHMRGRGMTLEAINLDNTVTVLSSVDHFDFNWHVSYLYADDSAPLLPAGTVLHIIGLHDNTAANRRNPDPAMWAGFGERSVDDMLQLWINVVYLEQAEFDRLVAARQGQAPAAPSVSGTAAAQAQNAPRNDLPQRYRTTRDWGQLPAGMKWAAVTAVEPAPDGSIYVIHRCADNSCAGRSEPPILKYDANGRLLKAWGERMFVFPHGATVDRDGNLWVTDARGDNGKGHQVIKFSPDGTVLMTLGKAGVSGSGPGLFDQPTDVVVAPNGDIFVTDSHRNGKNNRVVKFDRTGKFIKEWGKKGSGPGEISEPHTIAMDSRGRLFVGDRENNRIQIFDQNGTLLDQWRQFGRPSGISITKDDTIYVTDSESGPDTGAHELTGIKKGIRIGSAKDGTVTAFIEDSESTVADHSGAEGVGVDAAGNVYGAVVRRQMLERHVKK